MIEDARIEGVARALCVATEKGRDPGSLYMTARKPSERSRDRMGGSLSIMNEVLPLWTKYKGEAVRFLAALDAAKDTAP